MQYERSEGRAHESSHDGEYRDGYHVPAEALLVDLHGRLEHYGRYHDAQEHVSVERELYMWHMLQYEVAEDSHQYAPSRLGQPSDVQMSNQALDDATHRDDEHDNEQPPIRVILHARRGRIAVLVEDAEDGGAARPRLDGLGIVHNGLDALDGRTDGLGGFGGVVLGLGGARGDVRLRGRHPLRRRGLILRRVGFLLLLHVRIPLSVLGGRVRRGPRPGLGLAGLLQQ
mmetsp:Transcript_17616/g.42397  ORF Transcript_17616/g.42397 Transcript_17616/m.42397 type:complete len:228 (-) Transcript_17616:340-1023(-)